MRRPSFPSGRGPAAALLALIAATLVCAVAAVRAIRVAPPPAPDGAGAAPASGPAGGYDTGARATGAAVRAAVRRDPFRPDRTAPPERYRLPEERTSDGRPAAPQASARALHLVGTALLADGRTLAAFRLGSGSPPRVVRPGATIQGFKLIRVEKGRAVLSGPDSAVVLTVSSPGGGRP